MSEHHSAPSVPKLAPRDPDPVSADQHAAHENCDRALALAHKLSAELRKAQSPLRVTIAPNPPQLPVSPPAHSDSYS